MSSNFKKITGLILTIFSSSAVLADQKANSVTLGIASSFHHFSKEKNLDNGALYLVHAGYNITKALQVELQYGILDTRKKLTNEFKDGSHYTLSFNYHFWTSSTINPFINVGIGRFKIPVGERISKQSNQYGFGVKYHLSDRAAISAMVSRIHLLKNTDERLTFSSILQLP